MSKTKHTPGPWHEILAGVETFDGLAAVYPSLDNERGFARAKTVIKKAKGE